MTHGNSFPALSGRKRRPNNMHTTWLHVPKVSLILVFLEIDLEERWAVVDLVALQPPEHDECELWREVFVPLVERQRVTQDVIVFLRGKSFERPNAGLQSHFLHQAFELFLRIVSGEPAPLLEDRKVELQDALGPDPQGFVRKCVLDLEVITKFFVLAELACLHGLLVIYGSLRE